MADVELYEINEDLKNNVLKQGLYTVYDCISNTFLPPFLAQNADEAVRNFKNLVNYSQTSLTRFPEDFSLYYIGEFITCITGDDNSIVKVENQIFSHMDFIVKGSALIADDTSKFDAIKEGFKKQSDELANLAKNLQSQIGNVPNIAQQMNVMNSKFTDIKEKLEIQDEAIKNLDLQSASVSTLTKQIDLINSEVVDLTDKLEHFANSDVFNVPDKKSIIKRLFFN